MDSTDSGYKIEEFKTMRTNRILKWLAPANGGDGDSLHMPRRAAATADAAKPGAAPADAAESVEARTAKKLTEAIKKRWGRKDAPLAKAAGIHPSGLSTLKTKGTATVTPSLRSICNVIGVDSDQLVATGEIVEVEPLSRRPDLHALLEAVVGTPDEPAVEQVLRAFIRARKH